MLYKQYMQEQKGKEVKRANEEGKRGRKRDREERIQAIREKKF